MTRYDRLTALDDALGSVHAAIESLRESEDDDDLSDLLDDIDLAITRRRRKVRDDIEAHDNAERELECAGMYAEVL